MMNETNEEATFLYYEQCPECRSNNRDNTGDNLARYSDGHGYCFSCHYFEKSEEEINNEFPKDTNMITGEYRNLTKRKIDANTCKVFGYQVGNYNNQPVHIAPYYNKEHELIAQHIRFPNKKFIWLGDMEEVSLFGINKWRDGGKMVVVSEGEIDCMSISKIQGNRWPTVSVPSGSASAKKYIKKSLEWLEKFQNVIFLFDSDSAGKKAAVECSKLLSPRKAKIGRLPLKDANEMLVKERTRELVDSIWGASTYTPQGIITGQKIIDLFYQRKKVKSVPYCWNGLNKKLGGIRLGELNLICAGTGTGKSAVCREIASHLLLQGHKVGYIGLEEGVLRSIDGVMSVLVNAHVYKDEVRDKVSQELLDKQIKFISDKVSFFDHFGSAEVNDLMNRIRYMVQSLGCKYIFLDHIGIVVSGITSLENSDERRLIDNIMTQLRQLVEELNCAMFVVSHLRRTEGKISHEEGLQVSLSHLRGSHSLATLSNQVISFERNQQSETENNILTCRVLKNRFSGDTGVASILIYDKETGRLSEGKFNAEEKTGTTH